MGAEGGVAEEDVPVDEGLFEEEEEEPPDEDTTDPTASRQPPGLSSGSAEEVGVAVDESLFDLDNLQDLNLDDPAILEPPAPPPNDNS